MQQRQPEKSEDIISYFMLHYAAKHNDLHTVKKYIEQNRNADDFAENINALYEYDNDERDYWAGHHPMTVLMRAARYGNVEIVRELLKTPGIDVNRCGGYGTALIVAAKYSHPEVVKLLLTVPNIDIDATDFKDKTAKDYARQEKTPEQWNQLKEAVKVYEIFYNSQKPSPTLATAESSSRSWNWIKLFGFGQSKPVVASSEPSKPAKKN